MEEEGPHSPDVFRQPSKFLRTLLTDLLHDYQEVDRREYQSCHGRLVQDICLETPHIKRSQYSDIKKALIREERDKGAGKVKPHNCFVKDEEDQEADDFLFPEDEEITEMTDLDVVIDYKLERLVNLLRLSSRTVVFTRSARTTDKHYGTQCGISCLSDVSPPFSYFGLSALEKHNLVHFCVQLGHDGMAVKAGFPPDKTVEVYDSWYGLPQNPYKKDTDIVERESREADLVLVLSDECEGATADLLCSAATRSLSGMPYQAGGKGGALGIVIVSRQRTGRDCQATLKINCQPDDLVKRLVDRYDILADVPQEAVEDRLKYEARVTERSSVLSSLEDAVKYEDDDPRVHHGRLFSSICLMEPQRSEAGQLKDTDTVLAYKLRHLNDLMKLSGRTLVFTEGGLQIRML